MSEDQLEEESSNEISKGRLLYKFNYGERTADIDGFFSREEILIIPRSIIKDSTEYVIKSICKNAFRFSSVKFIQFSDDSEIQTIEKEAFKLCRIESITIPSSLINLTEGWCVGALELSNVKVSPNNPRYRSYDDQTVIGKSSIENDEFDVLVFCSRKATSITIPKFIKHIGPHCFDECKLLQSIEFEENSELQTIETCAFGGTQIQSFTLPSTVTRICRSAFSLCLDLNRFEIPHNSQLQTIECSAFNFDPIENLTIPSNLIDLQKGWCSGLTKLNRINVIPNNPRYSFFDEDKIIGKSSIENEEYNVLVFYSRDVKNAKIPSFIEVIESFAFCGCKMLSTVKFSNDSKLQIINSKAFSCSSIMEFACPLHLTKICNDAFSDCKNLRFFDIPNDSKLQIIEEGAFIDSSIACFSFPQYAVQIEKYAFASCKNLQIIEINENSQIKKILQNSFTGSEQVIIMIPVNLDIKFIASSKKPITRKINLFE